MNEEKWILTNEGKIQNVGSGKYLCRSTTGDEVTVEADSNTGETWSVQEEFIIHHPTNKVLTAYKDGSIRLEAKKSSSRHSDPEFISSRSLGVFNKLLALIDFVKVSNDKYNNTKHEVGGRKSLLSRNELNWKIFFFVEKTNHPGMHYGFPT